MQHKHYWLLALFNLSLPLIASDLSKSSGGGGGGGGGGADCPLDRASAHPPARSASLPVRPPAVIRAMEAQVIRQVIATGNIFLQLQQVFIDHRKAPDLYNRQEQISTIWQHCVVAALNFDVTAVTFKAMEAQAILEAFVARLNLIRSPLEIRYQQELAALAGTRLDEHTERALQATKRQIDDLKVNKPSREAWQIDPLQDVFNALPAAEQRALRGNFDRFKFRLLRELAATTFPT